MERSTLLPTEIAVRNERLLAYLAEHGLNSSVTAHGDIITEDRYTLNGALHIEPIIIEASWPAVREFLGY